MRTAIGLVHEFGPKWNLDLKVSYENKGYIFEVHSEIPEPTPTDKHVSNATLNYVTGTLLARYSVLRASGLEVGFGPYVGYLVGMKLVQKSYYRSNLVWEHQSRPKADDNYQVLDYGFALMVGSNLGIDQNKGVTLQFLYTRGIADVNKPQADQVINNTFSLLIGFYVCKSKP